MGSQNTGSLTMLIPHSAEQMLGYREVLSHHSIWFSGSWTSRLCWELRESWEWSWDACGLHLAQDGCWEGAQAGLPGIVLGLAVGAGLVAVVTLSVERPSMGD